MVRAAGGLGILMVGLTGGEGGGSGGVGGIGSWPPVAKLSFRLVGIGKSNLGENKRIVK